MNHRLSRLLHWSPRILGILFVAFISLFALDVFGEGYGLWGTIIALFFHLVPSFILASGVALGWRRPWLGALLFLGFAALYVFRTGNNPWQAHPAIAGPPTLIGTLFLADWWLKWERNAR